MNKLSQTEPPQQSGPAMASNPANGINNIPLNGENIEGVTKDEMRQLIKKIKASDGNFSELSNEVTLTADKVQDNDLRHQLDKLSKALLMSNNNETRTKDPITKELDPSYSDIANKIEQTYLSEAKNVYNNSKTAQVKKKKKTRGNPFRVLMGKVGKLLDHGVEKSDIVRYISKLKYWNKETIERAIDIVKEYNKKLEQDKDKDEKSEKSEKTADTVDLGKLVKQKEEVERKTKDVEETIEMINDTEEKGNKNASVKIASLNYDAKPNFEKRSTPELIMRACFLMDLQDYSKTTKQGDFKDAADKKGVSEELKQLKAALKDRGFDKEELSNLGLGK
jgi:hypothetical protein